jgi:hypothetical protein
MVKSQKIWYEYISFYADEASIYVCDVTLNVYTPGKLKSLLDCMFKYHQVSHVLTYYTYQQLIFRLPQRAVHLGMHLNLQSQSCMSN